MRDELLTLCKMHDTIKTSDLRLKGIDGEILPPYTKDRYHWLIRNFTHNTIDFFDKYRKIDEIKETIEWGKKRNYDLNVIEKNVFDYYIKYNNEEYIAALDFAVLSKLHYLIEYAYWKLNKSFYTKDFSDRLEEQ